jgi:hypothetical protein
MHACMISYDSQAPAWFQPALAATFHPLERTCSGGSSFFMSLFRLSQAFSNALSTSFSTSASALSTAADLLLLLLALLEGLFGPELAPLLWPGGPPDVEGGSGCALLPWLPLSLRS